MVVGLCVASLITSASWDLQYTKRIRQLRQRALAWRHIREDPGLQQKLQNQLPSLRDEAAAIARSRLLSMRATTSLSRSAAQLAPR